MGSQRERDRLGAGGSALEVRGTLAGMESRKTSGNAPAPSDRSKLRPMILKDIADRTGLDVSTISRVVNSKYVQTQFGIILLKSLFSEAMQTDSGEEVSSYEIKNILQQCIDEEDKRKPLTDETLMDILNSKGYRIARRTVAKYREMLSIPVARLRKQI